MDLPCVSVVTVCFNAEKTIGQTLESVASQTYPNVEHVIVDGGSTDHTLDVVKKFERPGLVWISGPDRGMYDAMNKGIGLASGQIIGILNADDWLEANALEVIVGCFRETGCDYTYGDVHLTDENGVQFGVMRSIDPETMGDEFLYKMPVTHQTCYVKRDVIERVGRYSLDYRLSADHDFVVRLVKSGARGGRLPEIIANFRMGGRSGGWATFRESREIAIRHGMSYARAYRSYYGSLIKSTLARVLPRPVIARLKRAVGSRHVWY